MSKLVAYRMIVVILATFAIVSVANAQATRTWVSGVGDDVNPCSRTAPCKTFAGAISKTAENGEISVLDPGGFGAVTITKSITINGEGTLGSVLNSGSNGIIVSVTLNPATATVYLHNISINGAKLGTDGIRYTAGATLIVDHCWIYGQAGHGIEVVGTGNLALKLNETTIENTGGDSVRMDTSAGQVIALISHSHLQGGTNGINAINNVRAGVVDTVVSHQTDSAIKTTGNDSIVNGDKLFITICGNGIRTNNAGTPSHVRLSDSIVTQNTFGLNTGAGGTIDSLQGNSVFGNSVDGSFTTTNPKQ